MVKIPYGGFFVSDDFEIQYKTFEGKNVHKIGTDEVYGETIDVYPRPFEYEEIELELEEEATIKEA